MKKFKGVLITGAAGGIGFELAKKAAADCEIIVMVNMDESRLAQAGKEIQQKFGINVVTMAKDLTAQESSEEIFNELKDRKIQVDVLINNAGIGEFGEFSNMPWEKSFKILQLDIVALTHLTKLFVNEMTERKKGFVLNIASMAAFQPGPLMAVYYASKAYVLSFSQSIARELKDTGVSVTALCPGPTKTSFQNRVGSENSWLSRWNTLASAEEVAGYGYKAMLKRKAVAIPGISKFLRAIITRFIPRNLLTNIVYKLQKINRKSYDHSDSAKIIAQKHKSAA